MGQTTGNRIDNHLSSAYFTVSSTNLCFYVRCTVYYGDTERFFIVSPFKYATTSVFIILLSVKKKSSKGYISFVLILFYIKETLAKRTLLPKNYNNLNVSGILGFCF